MNADAFHEYVDAEERDVAERYGNGFKCVDCIYWLLKDWRLEKALLEKRLIDHDDVKGQCRRHAPFPQTMLTWRTAQLVGQVAWATEESANVEHEKDGDYAVEEADVDESGWPLTRSSDWCGEGKDGRRPMSPKVIAQLEAMHAKAFSSDSQEANNGNQSTGPMANHPGRA